MRELLSISYVVILLVSIALNYSFQAQGKRRLAFWAPLLVLVLPSYFMLELASKEGKI